MNSELIRKVKKAKNKRSDSSGKEWARQEKRRVETVDIGGFHSSFLFIRLLKSGFLILNIH